jgi:hypothetical protein
MGIFLIKLIDSHFYFAVTLLIWETSITKYTIVIVVDLIEESGSFSMQ